MEKHINPHKPQSCQFLAVSPGERYFSSLSSIFLLWNVDPNQSSESEYKDSVIMFNKPWGSAYVQFPHTPREFSYIKNIKNIRGYVFILLDLNHKVV